jgi:hypothetical protein
LPRSTTTNTAQIAAQVLFTLLSLVALRPASDGVLAGPHHAQPEPVAQG